ncbi:sigma-54-dependent Fis family transcriptional regulator [Pseudomonas sp. H9]|uniref:sigma-54-dependent Fis family transcriptional regulator n=1 Tax=Pseudomonas sp. H9 TaxID=483968 RepID=UPI0010578BC5|nr:sigma-54-dependent Fis family transcriptional regulator [Pseudomonas sp. H9]TDF81579.1 sigma-54-dependent Fis family transcriptional regulator [Pseudomonas sp. H9]
MDAGALRHQQQLVLARQRFIDGAPLPEGLLPEPISRSWRRSRDAGLMPGQACLSALEPDPCELGDSDRLLADCVAPEIDRLWGLIGGPSWTIYCVNLQGVIVYGRQPHDRTSPLGQLHIGRRIHEARFGTTAPVCVLAEGQPIVLVGTQHYLTEFERFFCVSVPLHGLNGELIGALDFTGLGERQANSVMEQLTYAAMAAENRLYASLSDCQLLSLQHDPRQLDTPLQGLLAVDAAGRIQAANRVAQNLLGLARGRSVGEHLETLLGERSASPSPSAPQMLTLADGSRLYAQLLTPRSRPRPKAIAPAEPAVLGGDAQLNKRFDAARKAFAAGVPVLLQGETGTGKEVFARALHAHWKPDAPFLAINCSAIPESLIEAELFGYSEGTFTGARKGGAKGQLEAANGGTLLLDEIGDMPLALQTRLLRVLQERCLTRLGATTSIPLDVRVISATHCDLQQLIARRGFREDLYYRLSGLEVRLPALRQRTDLDLLIDRLAQRYNSPALHPETRRVLKGRDWPGNIRQLEQALRLAAALAQGESWVMPEHLAFEPSAPEPRSGRLQDALLSTIQQTLEANGGNMTATASQLGISRTTLYKKLREA